MKVLSILPLSLLMVLACGCSVRKFAINRVGDALASGGSTYEKDDDLELVGSALPFGLKLVETMLEESPRHKGLLQVACQGYATYAYVELLHEADVLAATDMDGAARLRLRARKLFLRAHNYGYRGLEILRPGISARMTLDPRAALDKVGARRDVPLLYWNAVALGLAISVSKNDAAMLARIPEVQALADRALALDESWQHGSVHEFLVTFAGAKPGRPDYAAIEKHYRRAVELSRDRHGGPHVAYAEAVCIPRQDQPCFRSALEKALKLDLELAPQARLQNTLAQRRAGWLLGRTGELFLAAESTSGEANQ